MTFVRESHFAPSDEKIIQYVTENIKNPKILTDYFSKLSRPLTANILTLKFSHGKDFFCNLLGYAAGTDYLKYLVRLALPEALDIALMEAPVNDHGPMALELLLLCLKDKTTEILEIIQKSSPITIGNLLAKQQYSTMTILILAFMMDDDQQVISALLNKASKDAICAAAKVPWAGGTILHWFIHHKINISSDLLKLFFSRLDIETKCFLIETPIAGLDTFTYLLTPRNWKDKEIFLNILFSQIGEKALDKLAGKKHTYQNLDLLNYLASLSIQPSIIDSILSNMNKDTLSALACSKVGNKMMWVSHLQKIFDTRNLLGLPSLDVTKLKSSQDVVAACILKNLHKETLLSLIEQPWNFFKMKKSPHKTDNFPELKTGYRLANDYLEKLGENNAPVLNTLLSIVLSDGYPLQLSPAIICRLNTENVSRYLIQHPEMNTDELRNQNLHNSLINWKYKSDFENSLDKAEKEVSQQMNFFLMAYSILGKTFLYKELALIIIDYIEKENVLSQRIIYEINNEQYPVKFGEMKSTYQIIETFFQSESSIRNRQEVTAIILSYITDYPYLDRMVFNTIKQEDELKKNRMSIQSKFLIPDEKMTSHKQAQSILFFHAALAENTNHGSTEPSKKTGKELQLR